jgi:hypothetical protein
VGKIFEITLGKLAAILEIRKFSTVFLQEHFSVSGTTRNAFAARSRRRLNPLTVFLQEHIFSLHAVLHTFHLFAQLFFIALQWH